MILRPLSAGVEVVFEILSESQQGKGYFCNITKILSFFTVGFCTHGVKSIAAYENESRQ